MNRRRRARWFGWWYLSIGIAFALLATYHLILRDGFWQAAIRFFLAAGFMLLARMEFDAMRK